MILAGARIDQHGHGAARRSPIFRRVSRCQHFQFAYGVGGRKGLHAAGGARDHRHAIHCELAVDGAAAVHGKLAGVDAGGVAAGGNARGERQEVENIAVRQRQVLYLRSVYRSAE